MSRVLVVGSANMDFTVAAPELPREGRTVTGGTFYAGHGGKGANQAVAARRLGAQVRFLGCIGNDPPGEAVARQLAAEGIPPDDLIRTDEAATGVALIAVDPAGRNQIAVASGANLHLLPESAAAHEPLFFTASVLLCQLEIPLESVRWALAAARRHGLATILNPAPARPLPDDLLRMVDCLTPNADEAEALTGLPIDGPAAAAAAAQRLLARGVARVVVTLGAGGALVCDGRTAVHYPAFAVEAADTTGAGDAFNGALAVGLAAGGRWEEILPLANATAALACTRRGAQASFPSRSEVEAFLAGLKR